MDLTDWEKSVLAGTIGTPGNQMAMQLVVEAGRILGAKRLVEVQSSHIDGCLYHGDSGVFYCEKLAASGARVSVPSTTNVGALNLLKPDQVRLPPEKRKMAYRLMVAHQKMGCASSWTCAPYQAGMRPEVGDQVAWGESNAVAFVNTVLGARTNRYGDFLDIACAISARAPYYGLHCPDNRPATLLIDVSGLSKQLRCEDAFYPVLGAMIGRITGSDICAVNGIPVDVEEDQLKSLCAGAAATGSVALMHIIGVTPEALDQNTALANQPPAETVNITPEMLTTARNSLSLAGDGPIDCVCLGSPHFSLNECQRLLAFAKGRKFKVPVYVCIGRHTMEELSGRKLDAALQALGVEFVVDTCIVVTPILPQQDGIMMTNSAKFAHYASGNTGYAPVFGSLSECVESAMAATTKWDDDLWS
jgi:predicted aconitase